MCLEVKYLSNDIELLGRVEDFNKGFLTLNFPILATSLLSYLFFKDNPKLNSDHEIVIYKNKTRVAGKMAQQLRVLAAFSVVLGSIPRTIIVIHNCCNLSSLLPSTLLWPPKDYTHTIHRHTCRKIASHININP